MFNWTSLSVICYNKLNLSCFGNSLIACGARWLTYLVSWDVVTELKKKNKNLPCLFPRHLTIIHTMNLLTLETLLFSQCEDVVFLLAVFLKC